VNNNTNNAKQCRYSAPNRVLGRAEVWRRLYPATLGPPPMVPDMDVDGLTHALIEIVGEASASVRECAQKLTARVAEAASEGGSSQWELDRLVNELRKLAGGA
jgi:hypothetical protein